MSRITTCPHCATRLSVPEGITDKTLICPHCLADVDNAGSGSQIRAADINTDVKRDLNVGCIVLAVLIGLCVIGIAMAIGNNSIPFLFYSCAALAVLVSIAVIHMGYSGVRNPSVAGACIITLLVLGVIVAIFFFFFITCASLASRGGFH
jgi:hypothetical protein